MNELASIYLKLQEQSTIERILQRNGFISGILTIDDQQYEIWIKDHKKKENNSFIAISNTPSELRLVAGFPDPNHFEKFRKECITQSKPFEVYFRKGGFIYRFTECRYKAYIPARFNMKLENEIPPIMLKDFRLWKFLIRYKERWS